MSSNEVIQPSNEHISDIDTQKWPLLLKGYGDMIQKTSVFSPLPCGHSPLKRPLAEHLKYGVINLDKPSNPSSHEVVSWVKTILQVEKTGHSGTLDPKVTGSLIICIDRATRIAKSQQNAGKQYVAVLKLYDTVDFDELRTAVEKFFTGKVYQCPPAISAVKKQLRVREIYKDELLEYDPERNLAVLKIDCEAGTYIRTLCEHIGLYLGVGGEMAELRRTRTGNVSEDCGLVTMHDLLDAKWLLDTHGDESYIRRVVRPCEWMLCHYKRLVMKDTAVDAICFGAKVLVPGILRLDRDIKKDGDPVIAITTKGEAIALINPLMTTEEIIAADHGIAGSIKRVIMDRETYTRSWGKGTVALKKKEMIKKGLLDTNGKPNDKTPSNWLRNYLEGKLNL